MIPRALVAATERGHRSIVSLLLGIGADVKMILHDTTSWGLTNQDHIYGPESLSRLLDRGVDVDLVVHHTTALVAAAEGGYNSIVSLLLDKGADVNMIVNDTTALIAAMKKGHENIEVVRLLLDAEGTDLNIAAGHYGAALITAICTCQSPTSDSSDNVRQPPPLLMLILGRNPDVSTTAGVYGTALMAAISNLQFPEQTIANLDQQDTTQSSSGWQWTFLDKLLLSESITQDHINVEVGEYGAPLTAAIRGGNMQLLRFLVARGGDVRLGDSCRTAIGAALAAGWDSQRLHDILQYLVDEGADINVVSSQEFGSALGQAAYMGNMSLVTFLLGCGADPLHVGGTYYQGALEGAYPTALDAALSLGSNAQSDPDLGLITELSKVMECNGKFSQLQRSPPFPMPFTKTGAVRNLMVKAVVKMDGKPDTCYDDQGIRGLPVSAALTAQHADISCAALNQELIIQGLVQLVIGIGTDTLEFKRYENWIRNDVRYFVTRGYDFGEAYAAARVGWRHFRKPEFVHVVERHRGLWLRNAQKIDKERVNSIYRDNTGQEMIKLPYEVMPRRLWDLKSNRVVEFRMLHSELLAYESTTEWQLGKARAKVSHSVPVYWAISHSWEVFMDPAPTPINQHQWHVPLPRRLDLEHGVRQELLSYGIEYVWLDVLCLRQHAVSNVNPSNSQISGPTPFDKTKTEEWKLDVPTIGNVYRVAQGIVRYFNGLGRPFCTQGWDSDRHWLKRAWTLQEIKTENSTINGGILRGSAGSTSNIMNTRGMVAGQVMTLRRAIRPVLKLAADVDSPSGCSLYALVKEMSQRKATQSTDNVAGLVYLLRLTQLPTYDETVSDNDAWTRCLPLLPLARKIELLFDFPYRSVMQQRWFPTWSELMRWPEVNPDCEYSPAVQTKGHRHFKIPDLTDLSGEVAMEGSLFMSDIWALSHCHVTQCSAQGVSYEPVSISLGNNSDKVRKLRHELSIHSPSRTQGESRTSFKKKAGRAPLSKNSQSFKQATWSRLRGLQARASPSRAQASSGRFETNYEVSVKTKVYGFYGPYVSQKPIATTSPSGQPCEFTIATADLGHSRNWVVCEVVKKLRTRCTWDPRAEACDHESGESHQHSSELEIEVHVLRKVGVLRTDFCGEIMAGVASSGDGSALRRIHALFV